MCYKSEVLTEEGFLKTTKYGAANSSSQKPVLWPVSPNWSCDVSTMSIFTIRSPSFVRRPA